MPLSFVIVFLTVALDEGKSVGSYARALGIKNRLTMSRFLQKIGRKGRNGNDGLDLVTSKPDPSVYQGTQIFFDCQGTSDRGAYLLRAGQAQSSRQLISDCFSADGIPRQIGRLSVENAQLRDCYAHKDCRCPGIFP
jgi:hypothetical protein